MSHGVLSIIIFALVGLALPLGTIGASLFLRPRNPKRERQERVPYETGSVPIGGAKSMGFGFYQYALLFLLFDLAAVFLVLSALIVPYLSLSALVSIFVFIIFLCLTIGFVLNSKKYLEI